MRRTWALGHLLVGCKHTLLLYGLDEIVQSLVEVEACRMLNLFSDGRPIDVVQNRRLEMFC